MNSVRRYGTIWYIQYHLSWLHRVPRERQTTEFPSHELLARSLPPQTHHSDFSLLGKPFTPHLLHNTGILFSPPHVPPPTTHTDTASYGIKLCHLLIEWHQLQR